MPRTEAEVLAILEKHRGQQIRCVGRLHSWSRVLEGAAVVLDLRHLDAVRPRETGAMEVDVGAGCQIKRLIERLEAQTPWTLPSVGFITEQTIAGAVSTGTHGSGRHSLSHYVTRVRVARYDSQTGNPIIVEITDGDELLAARCSLGCLGVILSVTMQCRPKYLVEEQFQEYKSLKQIIEKESEYPLQQFYLVPWRWTYFAQHRRESSEKSARSVGLYHSYRYLFLDLGMHCLILLAVRWLRSALAVKAVFRWLAPAFVIRNWRIVGPASTQLVMEHELFRHIEMELFVQASQLHSSLLFLKNTLEALAGRLDDSMTDTGSS